MKKAAIREEMQPLFEYRGSMRIQIRMELPDTIVLCLLSCNKEQGVAGSSACGSNALCIRHDSH